MSHDDRAHWDRKWRGVDERREVHALLVQYASALPGDGVAVDVACGLGQNTIWLAKRGYRVLGVDLSRVALKRALEAARLDGAARQVCFVQADLDHWSPAPNTVDVVCVFRFLNRALIPNLRAALRPGGIVFYATRHVGLLQRQADANRRYLLARGELAHLFAGWRVLAHREGEEDAALVARKPA